jgi:Fe-S-cluster-containing dehydrogenase component
MENGTAWDVHWRTVSTLEQGAFPEVERHHLSVACNHCADPGCMKVCPVSAIEKRQLDGVVILHEDLCNGCGRCIGACPYGAPKRTLEGRASKCHFCWRRLDTGEPPACVETCPTRALQFGLLTDLGDTRDAVGFVDPSFTQPSIRFVPRRD